MFKLIRKHQNGIMIIVAAVVIIAFAFLYDPNRDSYRFSDATAEMYGRQIRAPQFQRIARTYDVIMGMGLYEFVFALSGLDRRYASQDNPNDDRLDFVFNTLLIREEADRNGIHPSTEEIESTIKGLQPFQSPSGQFDPQKWDTFVENLGAFGFDVKGIYQIVGDYIRFLRLQDLVASGILASPVEAEQMLEERTAKIFASTALVPESKFEDEAAVTDEEISQYYEDNKDTLLSVEKRALEYIFFKRPTADDSKPEAADATAGAEEANAGTDDLKDREKRFGVVVNDFSLAIVDASNQRPFDEVAADAKYAEFSDGLQSTVSFPRSDPPAGLETVTALLDEAFSLPQSRPIGNAIKGPDGYYFYKVTAIEPPASLPLEEAKEQIRETLHDQKLAAAVNDAAAALKDAASKAVKDGKSFAEAVSAEGYEATEFPMFTNGQPPREEVHGSAVGAAVANLNPGEVSDAVPVEGGALLVFLQSREFPVDLNKEAQLAVSERQLEAMDRQSTFRSWFQDRKTEANPIPLADPRNPPPAA